VPRCFCIAAKCNTQLSLPVGSLVNAADDRDDLGRMPDLHKFIFLLGLFGLEVWGW
jgi:hypothetical protein